MVRLTAALVSAILHGADITSITSLIVPRRDLDQLVGLEVCDRLTRLDLSDNLLSSLEGIAMCTRLQWLSIAGNQLRSLKGVENLTNLTVLNASRNLLTKFNEVAILTELRVLILNDNEIITVPHLDCLVNLNTIVLSRNPIRSLGNFAAKLRSLRKLSLSHCQVQVLGTALKRCVALEELRLSHNQLWSLPVELERNGQLRILDLGTNHFKTWSGIQVLGSLCSLVNLNLWGNPLCTVDHYQDEVVQRLPHLQILDGHPTQNLHKKQGKMFKRKNMDSNTHTKLETDFGNSQWTINQKSQLKSAIESKNPEVHQGGDSKDCPFVDLIFASEPNLPPVANDTESVGVMIGRQREQKTDDSGVVSANHTAKCRPFSGSSRKVAKLLTQKFEIGTGGASTWDDSDLSATFVQNIARSPGYVICMFSQIQTFLEMIGTVSCPK